MCATHDIRTGIDVEAIYPRLPGRLEDAPFDVFDRLSPRFEHRTRVCRPYELISYLGASLENRAIERGENAKPEAISELEAVDIMIQALHNKYPSWFGAYDNTEIDPADINASEAVLLGTALRDDYFGETLDPETHDVDPTDMPSIRRVAIPFAAYVLTHVEECIGADQRAQKAAAQQEIKHTVMEETYQADLTEEEVRATVVEALAELRDID